MIERISQSFIKDFKSYLDGDECGIIIHEKYINDRLIDDEDPDDPGAKELGAYFEFVAFGTLPKNGKVPVPEYMANGKDLKAPYRLAQINAKRVKKIITEDWGLDVVKSGWHVTKGRYTGTIDLFCLCTKDITFDSGITWKAGQYVVIDLKYSGLIGDRSPGYNKHGWKFTKPQKEYHGIQAKQYYFLTEVDFHFLVCQSNNKGGTLSDIKLFHIPISDKMLIDYLGESNAYFDQFQETAKTGFEARPSLGRCQKCPLREECSLKHTYPHPEVIDLNAE